MGQSSPHIIIIFKLLFIVNDSELKQALLWPSQFRAIARILRDESWRCVARQQQY
jgi:hypothetical protein